MAYVIAPQTTFGADFSRCRPLVFDPYLTNRRLLRDMLSGMGCERVMDCGRLRDTILTIETEQPNVLFLDWSEQVDAIDFLHRLRAPANQHRFLPVVVMTAYAGLNHIAAARDAGSNEFMLRPWSQQVLASRLRSIVEHPRLYIQGGGFFWPRSQAPPTGFPGPRPPPPRKLAQRRPPRPHRRRVGRPRTPPGPPWFPAA